MYFEIENPEKILTDNGYNCRGIGVHFEKIIDERKWFHAVIQPSGIVQIHIDCVKKKVKLELVPKTKIPPHYSINRSQEVEEEINKILGKQNETK